MSTDASAAPGAFRIFLPDGTLVMDSIVAQITQLTDERLHLRLQLRGEVKEEAYRPAQVPTVCPDMPR